MAGILFLCVANSARSQLAEAIARDLAPTLDVWSAGTDPSHVRPHVRRVLEEAGYDDKGLRSKSLFEVEMDEVDVIVTLCREEQCPTLPGKKHHIHWPLPDPASAPDEERTEAFRATRDELVRRLPPLLRQVETGALA
jgi:arsenate reductase (thioredoxin)